MKKLNIHAIAGYIAGTILLSLLTYWGFIIPHGLFKADPKYIIQYVHESGYLLSGLGIGTIGSIALPRLFQYFEVKRDNILSKPGGGGGGGVSGGNGGAQQS